MARLVLESGEGSGQSFEIGEIAVIGRLASCDVPIKDRKSSRNNTKVFLESGAYFVEDMGSSNGTLLNDRKITKSPLRNGDRITIGQTTIRFEAGTQTRAATGHVKPAKEPAPPPASHKTPGPQPSSPQAPKAGEAARSRPAHKPLPPHAQKSDSAQAPLMRERLASMETPPAGVLSPAVAAPVNPRASIASFETPPAGVTPPGLEDQVFDRESVDELDLGAGDSQIEVDIPSPAAPPAPEKPKVQVQFRVPIRSAAGGRGGLLTQDVTQRGAGFRAAVYIGAAALMAGIGYLAFKLASGAF